MYKNDKFIPVNEPLIRPEDINAVTECLQSGWISSEGPVVKDFEDKFAKYCSRKHGISCSNGTAALDLAVKALDLPVGSNVIIPETTIISCLSALYNNKLIPRTVDIELLTYNIDCSLIESFIDINTSAIMVVHVYGLPVDMRVIHRLAKKYSLKIIEDSAESIGLRYNNQICGSFGDVSTVSFYPNKHLTTGEGGMVLTNDENIAQKCRYYRNLCFDNENRFVHAEFGWNYRLTSLQASLGLSQLSFLEDSLAIKREIGAIYNHYLANIDCLQIPIAKTDVSTNCYWVYPIRYLNNDINSKQICNDLMALNIGTRPLFYPISMQPVLKKYYSDLSAPYPSNAINAYKYGFYVPSGIGTSLDKIELSAMIIANYFKK
jgi:perosamine synthetase